jgi:hypothetical protein
MQYVNSPPRSSEEDQHEDSSHSDRGQATTAATAAAASAAGADPAAQTEQGNNSGTVCVRTQDLLLTHTVYLANTYIIIGQLVVYTAIRDSSHM